MRKLFIEPHLIVLALLYPPVTWAIINFKAAELASILLSLLALLVAGRNNPLSYESLGQELNQWLTDPATYIEKKKTKNCLAILMDAVVVGFWYLFLLKVLIELNKVNIIAMDFSKLLNVLAQISGYGVIIYFLMKGYTYCTRKAIGL